MHVLRPLCDPFFLPTCLLSMGHQDDDDGATAARGAGGNTAKVIYLLKLQATLDKRNGDFAVCTWALSYWWIVLRTGGWPSRARWVEYYLFHPPFSCLPFYIVTT